VLAIAALSFPLAWASSPENAKSVKSTKVANDPAFHEQLKQVAQEYQSYGKVDDWMRWAPYLCSMPLPPQPRLSKSNDGGTHGKKVYFLYAKDRESYYTKKDSNHVGQAIVKEAWMPDLADGVDQLGRPYKKPKEKTGLFVMFKADAKTPNTDDGWVYGTLTADGKTVTSSGRVESCMGCHVQAPHGRLFGLHEKER